MILRFDDEITVEAFWDSKAGVWCAKSRDVPGLVIEANTLSEVVNEVRLVLPDLLELSVT